MTNTILLGEDALYPDQYDASLLNPLKRREGRSQWLEQGTPLPFVGHDRWTAYELSWLDKRGKPCVAMAEFVVPADSECIIESKSFKYYLNSLNQTVFDSKSMLVQTLSRDLSYVAGANVEVQLISLADVEGRLAIANLDGVCIDSLPVDIEHYRPEPALLECDPSRHVEGIQLVSHLLKSNCPVTGQPDWASVQVSYSGGEISAESLLKYIISYRQHQGYHENCVERIFMDIWQRCSPDTLYVYARYTRRGGLDINPFRASCQGQDVPQARVLRQ